MGTRKTSESIMMAALSRLSSSQLNAVCCRLCSTLHRHNQQLVSLLTSPALFSHTLNHLHSLSLSEKSALIAGHFLSFLHLLTPFLFPWLLPSPSYANRRVRLRDLDSALLLLFFCEVRQHHPKTLETVSPAHWQGILKSYGFDTMLNNNNLCMVSPYQVLGTYVDIVVKCRRFVSSKVGCKVAASVEAVVALASVSVEGGGGVECVICKEEMKQGRDVCELPCHHKFHWKCVLPWFTKTNTCPCCRFLLPTDDVYGEIQRLWDAIIRLGES